VVVTYTIELQEWHMVSENIIDFISFTGMKGTVCMNSIPNRWTRCTACKLREEKR
jgi:hypothetical protein